MLMLWQIQNFCQTTYLFKERKWRFDGVKIYSVGGTNSSLGFWVLDLWVFFLTNYSHVKGKGLKMIYVAKV